MNPLLSALVAAGIITQDEADRITEGLAASGENEATIAFGEFEITQQDIRLAMSTWDELMPEYRGLLDAEIVDDGNVDRAVDTSQEAQ